MKPRLSARLLFAVIGAIACLAAALLLEGVYAPSHTTRWVDDGETPVLLFFPHTRNELQRRLREANATSGDVEITLSWDNLNDLDLHCIDPNNKEVFYGSKGSMQTEGVLDVDRNFQPPFTNRPVEHIYWPHGRAPQGRYRVFVDHYMRHGALDATRYQITVKEYGHIHRYSGTISHAEHRMDSPGQLVTEFNVGPTGLLAGLPVGFWRSLFVMGCWAALISAAFCGAVLTGLSLFYRRVYKKRLMPLRRAARLTAIAAAWSVLGGVVGQLVLIAIPAAYRNLHPTQSHMLGLMALASIAGLAIGGRIPHIRRGWAFVIGELAGAASGLLLLHVYWRLGSGTPGEISGRLAAATVIGLLFGLLVELIVEPPPPPEEPIEVADSALDTLQPLSLRANRIGPTGKLRRAGRESVHP